MGCSGSKAEPASKGSACPEKAPADPRAAWERVRALLPREKDEKSKLERIELFKKFDVNGSGRLSFNEVCSGCERVLQMHELTTRLRDIVKRAFEKAKALGTKLKGRGSSDFVEFLEFRLMLCFIFDFFELTIMFDEIDKSGDTLISKEEFTNAVPKLTEWGAVISDVEAAFAAIDANGTGAVSFDEFASWAATNKLEAFGDPYH
uniref:Uncharacterized protein TCIL3000_8_5250 n=1 Tax=Trypanosoma congolense (strain IL3000) TaxID=1068625 RepID=G0USE0_TRYCI|nr:unnamed protein product [Trypanosoma congolense IL3000]